MVGFNASMLETIVITEGLVPQSRCVSLPDCFFSGITGEVFGASYLERPIEFIGVAVDTLLVA